MSQAIAPLLQVSDLSFSYPDRPIIEAWSQDFGPGISLLSAPDGAGSSTLLNLIGGALAPSAGRLIAAGLCAATDPQAYARQVFAFDPELDAFQQQTAQDYFDHVRNRHAQREPGQWERHIAGFKLEPHLHKPMYMLSTGTRRKVGLTAALSVQVVVCLLDEPLAALDLPSIRHLAAALAEYAAAGSTAWLIASHEPLPERLPVHATIEFTRIP
ncbi:MAG: ATP-binding cassette domain-containing protein [Burkholderiaceae bacterium]|nr:ATP-binding cassette domain-containing protein [Burkholderiaceae bacterium]